jgi:hypothetical protein
MAFNIMDVPRSEDVPAEVLMAFDVGHAFHQMVQEIAERELGATSEVIGIYPDEVDLSCHADLVYERKYFNPGGEDVRATVCGEIKTISGYGFLIAVGKRAGDELPGPKKEHICQAALCAAAPNINAKLIHMIYIDKDKHSIAEWVIDMDEPLEKLDGLSPRDLAAAEIDRMHGILGRIDAGMLPARHIPGVGRVDIVPDPDGRGQPWNCRYCGWNAICKPLPAKPTELTNVVEVIVGPLVNAAPTQDSPDASSGETPG